MSEKKKKSPASEVEIEGKSMVEILEQIDLFTGLGRDHLTRVADIGQNEKTKTGKMVFDEGDAGDKFYIVLEGAVRISRVVPGMGEEALAVLRPGAYFGEMSLIDSSPRSATAFAHESLKCFVISRTDLEDLLFVDRDLAYEVLWNFVRTLSSRLRATNDKMTFLATSNKF
jgi:CRP/FNR family cyclic AMP-dependent transcriptional regulator